MKLVAVSSWQLVGRDLGFSRNTSGAVQAGQWGREEQEACEKSWPLQNYRWEAEQGKGGGEH